MIYLSPAFLVVMVMSAICLAFALVMITLSGISWRDLVPAGLKAVYTDVWESFVRRGWIKEDD